ncbi:MAG: hypothetical protein ACYSUQ_00775 [Planctomycetota bacterium]
MLLFLLLGLGLLIGAKYGNPLAGAAIGFGVFAGCVVGVLGTATLFCLWQSEFPLCPAGKCRKGKDYEFLESTDRGQVYRCVCGTKYVHEFLNRRNTAARFAILLEDGTTRAYMRHSSWGRWKPDRNLS